MSLFHIILAAIALGILVFIHELGHYIVARKLGMTVEIFSIGFGKPILKWRVNGVDWQLGCLPFGGYVKIAGMELGKKEKDAAIEPYDIPNGFFSKSPFKRLCVALAGPVANFILAFVIFCILWLAGGRSKPFSEFTHVIGWVDPKSETYKLGVRPGDRLDSYGDKPYTNSKDLLYAAMLGGKEIQLKGAHLNYVTGIKKPFSYEITSYPSPVAQKVNGVLTTGILSGASYLIYDRFLDGTPNPLSDQSPMHASQINYRDRLVWADGEFLFSMDQLSHIVNSNQALLTIQRGDQIFLSRQTRVLASDMTVPSYVRNEWTDWLYESNIHVKWNALYVIPYIFNNEGYIESRLNWIDPECAKGLCTVDISSLHAALQPGDRILAIDGRRVHNGIGILETLQTHRVQLIVEKDMPVNKLVSTEIQDNQFISSLNGSAIEKISKSIGTEHSINAFGRYVLLEPIEPKTYSELVSSAALEETVKQKRAEIEKIKDKEVRNRTLDALNAQLEKRVLGINLQDRRVIYNPTPWSLFGTVFTETWDTLKALVSGYLHPKWLSGPIGIVQVIHQGWSVGIREALFWMGAISVNLGFLNLLPIPILDGGYICLSLWEICTRRKLKAKTMERLIVPFAVLLIALLIFLTFQDVSRLFN